MSFVWKLTILVLHICVYVSVDNLIGKGGHAEVYKGCLPDGQVVAVKMLMKNEQEAEDRAGPAGDFLAELGIIAHIKHPNATRLIGFGIDQGLFFVLQLAPRGSLASLLFGTVLNLSLTHIISSLYFVLAIKIEFNTIK